MPVFRLPRRLVSHEPELNLPEGAKLIGWDPARRALTVRLAPGSSDDPAQERLLLIEEGYVIEGPKGWRRAEAVHRSRSVLWREAPDAARTDD
jgi:hypothetical protein